MDAESVDKAAGALLDAYATRAPLPPLTAVHPGLSVDDAYAIQLAQVQAWTIAGARIKGHKIGLTSTAMQRQMGVNEPDFGHLLESMFLPSDSTVSACRFLQPRIEPEMAFVLGRPLRGPGVTVTEAIAAVDFVLPALEIIDSRIADWRITLADTIADNASSGGVVLGSQPTRLNDLDLALTGCLLHVNGRLAATGAGGAVLGSPVNAVVWLANVLGPRGITMEAGHVVLPGSVTAAVPVSPGDSVTATFAAMGSVSVTFGATS